MYGDVYSLSSEDCIIEVLVEGDIIRYNQYTAIPICTSTLVICEDTNYLIDPGIPSSLSALLIRLNEMKLDITDVKNIIITHMHGDHYLNMLFFDKAKIFVHRASIENWYNKVRKFNTFLRAIESVLKERAIYITDDFIKLTNSIYLIRYNIHDPGHLVVVIYTKQGTYAVVGDIIPYPQVLVHLKLNNIIDFIPQQKIVQIMNELINKYGVDVIIPGHSRALSVNEIRKILNL